MQKYFLSGGTNADTIVSVSVCGYPADAFVDAMAGLGFCFWCSIRGMQAAGCKQVSLGKQASRTFASKPQTQCHLSPSLCLYWKIQRVGRVDRELMQHQGQEQASIRGSSGMEAGKQNICIKASDWMSPVSLSLSLCLYWKRQRVASFSRATHYNLLCFRVSFNWL